MILFLSLLFHLLLDSCYPSTTYFLYFNYFEKYFLHHVLTSSLFFPPCRESLKAEAVGLTWYEWWGDRTEDDVMRDDAERLEEEAVEYEEDSVGIADDVSDGTDDFSF